MVEKKNEKLKEKKRIDWGYNLGEYWDALRNWKGLALVALTLAIIIELTNIVPNFLFKELVDKGTLFAEGSLVLGDVEVVLFILAGLYILNSVVGIFGLWFRNVVLAKLELNSMKYLKNKYLNHIVGLDHKFHSTHKTGSLIARMNRGIGAVERITDILFYNFLPMFVQLIAVGLAIAYFDVSSALVVVGVVVVFGFFSYFYQRGQEQLKIASNDAEDNEKAGVSDVFTNIDSIKYFGREKWIANNFSKLTEDNREKTYRFWRSYSWLSAVQNGIVTVGMVLLLFFPLVRFLDGFLTVAEVVFIYTTYRNLMMPLWSFVGGMIGFHRAVMDFQDFFAYGKVSSKVKDKAGAKNAKIRKGRIEFRGVDFGYGKRKKVFDDFNLVIPEEKKVAFVGHSGCGKSTLVNLLYRFYDVDSGAVMVDDVDVRDVRQESLRGEMSIVPQECVLFDDTIWNNIKFSRPSASKDEVWRAIRFAQLDKVIDEMPRKEKTIVGERGVRLSGGEKQRVSIARALLADKKILVLDEATSALDSETEFEIQKSLGELMKGRTSIIIAHRLSTIMHADLIVVMRRGRVVEMGTHEELLARKGEYKRLWGLQKGGYIR